MINGARLFLLYFCSSKAISFGDILLSAHWWLRVNSVCKISSAVIARGVLHAALSTMIIREYAVNLGLSMFLCLFQTDQN